MNYKKNSIIIFSSIVVLAIAVVIIVYQYVGSGTREIKEAKKFIGLLYSKDIVAETEDYNTMSFKAIQKAGGTSEKTIHSVETRDFGIDLDSDYKVVGFINKVSKVGDAVITEEEAIKIAESYLEIMYEGTLKFKEVIKTDSEISLPYYKVVFSKYKDEYPFYSDEVGVYIDKVSSKLDGYTNISSQLEPKDINIVVKSEEAEKTATEDFLKLNNNGKIESSTYLAYCNDKENKKIELAYVITLIGTDINSKETKYKYFVSAETGKVINSQKDIVKTTITNS